MHEETDETMILLVEDDQSLSAGIAFALTNEGYRIETAETLAKATPYIDNPSVELILLDVMLPDGSGFDFCKRVREKSQVPVIFLTARDEEVSIVMGLDSGADDYITKPFRLSELLSRVKAVLRRYEKTDQTHPSSTKMCDRGIEVDPQGFRATKKGRDLGLSVKEFRLLVLFMKNPGRVLTKDAVLEALTDDAAVFYDDNTLSVYIRRLREKIEDDPAKPTRLTTVRGAGYRWETR